MNEDSLTKRMSNIFYLSTVVYVFPEITNKTEIQRLLLFFFFFVRDI